MALLHHLGYGQTSIVVRDSDEYALKCAHPRYTQEVEHERTILQHLGPHQGIVEYFDTETEVRGRIRLRYYPFDVRAYLATGADIPLEA